VINIDLQAVILAAGKATRFNTGRTKLLETVCGRPMALYATMMLEKLGIDTTVVVGHQEDEVKKIIQAQHSDAIIFVHQEQQLGTGHALLCTHTHWHKDNILVLNGDMPLVTSSIIEQLYNTHQQKNAAISFVVSHLAHQQHAYGRVIKKNDTTIIVEAKDFKGDITAPCVINAGIYLINRSFLEKHIKQIDTNNASQEFYLTDLVSIASNNNLTVAIVQASFDHIRGINTLQELYETEQIQRTQLIHYWMQCGVRFINTHNTNLAIDITIGAGTVIGSGVHLGQGTIIGQHCTIGEYTRLDNTTVGDNTHIQSHCVITNAMLGDNVTIGPFAHLRNDTVIEHNASIGNFVEIKKSYVGNNSKARHLAYIGDTHLGKNVNIGAGTITCNYNGVTKEKTIIKDNVFIGSNNTLVAPLTIEQNSFTAAGSTITHDVPKDSLAFGRAKQITKEGYAPLLREKLKKQTTLVPKKNLKKIKEHE